MFDLEGKIITESVDYDWVMKKVIKFIVVILLLLSGLQIQAQQCRLRYHIRNLTSFNRITFNLSNEQLVDSSGKQDNTIILKCGKEPETIGVFLDNDYGNYNIIYIYDGNIDMIIDSGINNIKFVKDDLNTHQQELMQGRKAVSAMQEKLDNLIESLDSLDPQYKICLDRYGYLEDSLSDIYYQSSLNHLSSFASLQFISFSLAGKGYFDINKLSILFQSLSYNLSYYPTYDLCKEVLAEKPLRYNVGDTIKPIILKDSQGRESNLKNLLRKDFLYIDFWGSHCGAVPDALKILKKIAINYSDYIDIIGISDDTDPLNYKEFLKNNKLPWRNFCDYKGYLSPMFRHFGIGGTPRDVLINHDGIILAKEFHAYDATELLNRCIVAESRKNKIIKKERLKYYFKPADIQLNKETMAKLDSLIARLGSILCYEISIKGFAGDIGLYSEKVEIASQRACCLQDYLISHGISQSRIICCKWEALTAKTTKEKSKKNNSSQQYAEILLEWVPGKADIPQFIPPPYDNPCEMYGDLKKVKDWKVGDSLFFCYLAFSDAKSTKPVLNEPETISELNCLVAILLNNKNLNVEINCIECYSINEPDFGDRAYVSVLYFLTSKNIDAERITYKKTMTESEVVQKIKVPCTKRIYTGCAVWYIQITKV